MDKLHMEQKEFAERSNDRLAEHMGGQTQNVVATVKDLFDVIRGQQAPVSDPGSPQP